MTEARYNFESPAVEDLVIIQGSTYCDRWEFGFGDDPDNLDPFPFFSDIGELLWKGRCMFRGTYADKAPMISLTSEDNEVTIDYIDDPDTGKRKTFYGLLIPAAKTALIRSGKPAPVYDIEFERLSDGWVIRPQKGTALVDPEATK
jgi:hypothetical protein